MLPVDRGAHVATASSASTPTPSCSRSASSSSASPIDDTVANDVMAQLLTLESMDPDRDISIYINSPGGSFTALTAIYDTMQFVRPRSRPICLGQAASAAAVILAAGTPGKRFALANSRILIHQPSTEGGGQASDLEIQAREILRMRGCSRRCSPSTPDRPMEQVEQGHRARQDPHRRGGPGVRPDRPGHHHPQAASDWPLGDRRPPTATRPPREQARMEAQTALAGVPSRHTTTRSTDRAWQRERLPRGTHR